jgi:hypothetical protein
MGLFSRKKEDPAEEYYQLRAEMIDKADDPEEWECLAKKADKVKRDNELYYCGLCGKQMPISHFPHSH